MQTYTLVFGELTYCNATRDELIDAGVPSDTVDAHILKQAKADKLKAAADAAQAFVDAAVKDASPAFEQATYVLQATEAAAWKANPKAATPVLDGIAAARGIDPNYLKTRASAKSAAFQALCAHIAGQRQSFEDAIDAAGSMFDLAEIEIGYSSAKG